MKQTSDFKTANSYARAMYDGSSEAQELEALYADVLKLNNAVQGKNDFFRKLGSPLLKYAQKEEILQDVCRKSGFSQSMLNTLKLLAQNNRLNILEQTLRQFILLYYEKHNMIEAEITTIMPLNKQQEDLLKNKLEKIFAKQIILRYIINPQILGGLIIKCGTGFIDNSIKHKLNALEQLMKGIK